MKKYIESKPLIQKAYNILYPYVLTIFIIILALFYK
jgi:hypothetical protein